MTGLPAGSEIGDVRPRKIHDRESAPHMHLHTSWAKLSFSFLPPPMVRVRMMPVPPSVGDPAAGGAPAAAASRSLMASAAFFESHPAVGPRKAHLGGLLAGNPEERGLPRETMQWWQWAVWG